MALIDTVLNLLNKTPKNPDSPKVSIGSRSEREAKIKDKAGMVINVFALLLAVNTYFSSSYSSLILSNTIKANDTWAFYQAKSMKQTMAEYARDDAIARKNDARVEELTAKINRYESDPEKGEGKKELFEKAKALEYERDEAKKRSPWMSYASTAFQLSIVLLSASILAVNMMLFWGSFAIAGVGLILMSQGLWLWI